MHIPDGYLAPQTYLPAFAVMIAFWSAAIAKVKKTLRLRQVPLLALGAAFSFVIMLFNVPIPGGSTGHAVGAVLVAILFGPWAATIVVSLALIVQALVFGDGGITAIGANCLNMAVVSSFVGWGVYRLIAGSAPAKSMRHWLGGAIGGWLGLTAAAAAAGIEFGIQPLIAHDAAGRALYCPFGLSVALPTMGISHLLAFGIIEGVVTALVVAYFQRSAPDMLTSVTSKPMAVVPRIAVALGVLVILAPIGLYLPARFHAGSAWGEWSGAEIRTEMARMHGSRQAYIPRGIAQAEQHGWHAPMPDYNLPKQESLPLSKMSLTYILSGAVGMMVIGALIMLCKKIFARKDDEDAVTTVDA